MSDEQLFAANEILEIIPLVMRTLRTEISQPTLLTNPGHFRLLLDLTEGPHSLSELAERHNVTLPTMSNTVSTLAEHGIVRRTRSEEDRRRVVIELTGNGKDLLGRIQQQAAAQIAAVLRTLTHSECRDLITGLAILRTAFTRKNHP